MGWLERLLPASWRGVPFYTERRGLSGGRRLAVHEYPLRDKPYVEDLGRRARTYRIDAFLVGQDYDIRLAALTAALDQAGAGVLSHPDYGLLRLCCERYQVDVSTAEGGFARITLDLGEAGEDLYPSAVLDTVAKVVTQAAQVYAWASLALQGALALAAVPALASQGLASLLGSWCTTAALLPRGLGLSTAQHAQWAAGLVGDQAAAASLAGDPAAVSTATLGRLATLTGVDLAGASAQLAGGTGPVASNLTPWIAADWAGYGALADLANWDGGLPAALRPDAQAALVTAVQDAAVAGACVCATRACAAADRGSAVAAAVPGLPVSAQELAALQAALLAVIDARADAAGDALYQAWADLRTAVANDLASRALQAPRRQSYTPPATLPALVIAHRLYQDAGRAAEIVRRNRIRHPGFVPGGIALEVLDV